MRYALAFLFLLVGTGCDTGSDCTDELVSITVRVVDQVGDPIGTLQTRLVNTRNLQTIGFTQSDSLGIYTVLTDRNLAFVQRSGDVLDFEVANDTVMAVAQFTIGRQDCHVAKFDGPDTIVAEPRVSAP